MCSRRTFFAERLELQEVIESFAMLCGICKVMIASYRIYILYYFSKVYHTRLESN